MKELLSISFIFFCFTSNSQSIDSIVNNIATQKTDSLANTLDYSYEIDATKQGIFNIDTIFLNDGDYKYFLISLTAISGPLSGDGLYAVCVRNSGGVYSIPRNVAIAKWSGTTSVSITPTLINQNKMCVI